MRNAARVARNTMANWVGLGAGMLVLLVLTPYITGVLGKERFGIYAMASQSLAYVALLTLGMRASGTRFACRDIVAEDIDGLNATCSTMAVFYLAVGAVGLIPCTALGLAAPSFFNISPEYAAETVVLFVIVGLNFLVSLQTLNFNSVLTGHQRYDLINLGYIVRDVFRAVFIVLVFSLGWTTLGGLATSLMGAFVVALATVRYLAHRQQPGLRVRTGLATRAAARRVVGFGAWNGLVQVGSVIVFAGPPFVVAKLLGPDQVIYYAIPLMLADRLRIFVVGMSNTLTPMAAATLVTGDRAHFRALVVQGTKAAATICLPIGAVAIVMSKPFLGIWMGPDYAWAWAVFAVMMVGMFGRICQSVTHRVLIGGGRIRGLAFIQMGAAVVVITLTIVLAPFGVLGMAAGFAGTLIVSHSIAVPIYVCRQIEVPVLEYCRRAYAGPIIVALAGVGVALVASWRWPPTGWASLIAEGLLSLGVAGALAWRMCLDRSIRESVVRKLSLRWANE